MKSAYEIAMERLEKQNPTRPLSNETKERLAEIDSLYVSKIAERKVFLEGQIAKCRGTSDEIDLRRQLTYEVARLEEESELKKEEVRKESLQ